MGELVEFPGDGGTLGGYVAAGDGAGPALIVIPERGQVGDHATAVCDRLAAEGFTALAPDLSDGGPGEGLASERMARGLSGAVDFLQGHPAVRGQGVGVVGFSVGGGLALWLASIRPDRVRAVVPFYGTVLWEAAQPDWSAMTAAVEGHFAEHDDRAGPEAARKLEEILTEQGLDVRMFLYPGTRPPFFDDTRPEVYDEDAARQAWVRTLEFLRARLG